MPKVNHKDFLFAITIIIFTRRLNNMCYTGCMIIHTLTLTGKKTEKGGSQVQTRLLKGTTLLTRPQSTD